MPWLCEGAGLDVFCCDMHTEEINSLPCFLFPITNSMCLGLLQLSRLLNISRVPFWFFFAPRYKFISFCTVAKLQTLFVKAITKDLAPECARLSALRSRCTYLKLIKSVCFVVVFFPPWMHIHQIISIRFKCRVNGISANLLKWLCAPAAKTSLTRSFTLNRLEMILLRCWDLVIGGVEEEGRLSPSSGLNLFCWKGEDRLWKHQQ